MNPNSPDIQSGEYHRSHTQEYPQSVVGDGLPEFCLSPRPPEQAFYSARSGIPDLGDGVGRVRQFLVSHDNGGLPAETCSPHSSFGGGGNCHVNGVTPSKAGRDPIMWQAFYCATVWYPTNSCADL